MGLYVRKSVKVGPFRFNLSKSGVGVSAGVTGFRIGTGPRGNYIHMGRGGLYYRTTLSPKPQSSGSSSASSEDHGKAYPQVPSNTHDPQIPSYTHDPLHNIDSGDISGMVDSSSKDLIEELNEKRQKIRSWPLVSLLGTGITVYIGSSNFANWAIYLSAGLSFLCILAAAYRDTISKNAVILYDIEDEFQGIYESLHNAFEQMAKCRGQWHLEAEGRVRDSKYHAGADSLVRRKPINLSLGNPPYIKTNVATPAIPVGSQTLYFFPDMVLIFDQNGVGAVSYDNLSVQVASQKFIEEGTVPSDASVVEHTWKYVNKRGGPDKRFKDNRQIPVALYEDVHFSSDTGLNERIELSKTGVSALFAQAIRSVGSTNRSFS